MNGYVQLRRGIYEHLESMPRVEVVLYVALLCLARVSDGVVRMTVRDLAADIRLHPSRVSEALRGLASEHGPKGCRYIKYDPATNQHGLTTITILKWRQSAVSKNGTALDTALDTSPVQHPDITRTAPGQHDTPDLRKEAPDSFRELVQVGEEVSKPGNIHTVGTEYERLTGKPAPAGLSVLCADHPTDRLMEAVRRAAESGKPTIPYIRGVAQGLAVERWKPGSRGKKADAKEAAAQAERTYDVKVRCEICRDTAMVPDPDDPTGKEWLDCECVGAK